MENKYTEKLSKLLFFAACTAIFILAFKYFGNVIGYVALGFVIALISKPLMRLMRRIRIKGRSAPDALLAFLSIVIIMLVLTGVFSALIPVVKKLFVNISIIASGAQLDSLTAYFADLNVDLRRFFKTDPDFRLELFVVNELSSMLSINLFGNVLGTVASTFASIAIGLFAVIFIAFFLIKDESIFPRFAHSFTPAKHSEHMTKVITDVEMLLSRYFVGLLIEMTCVGLIDFIGMWAVLRLDFESALGIGFLAGLLNIIPYLGPLAGGIIGTVMGVVIKICSTGSVSFDMSLGMMVTLCIVIFLTARLVDDFVLQPLIYSTSIKASPLGIFIVLLLAGTIGGIVGMVVAIPAYTVVRVIAFNFFPDSRYVTFMKSR